MIVEQEILTKLGEPHIYQDLTQDQKRSELANEVVPANNGTLQFRFNELIHDGQKVFLSDNQSIGRVIKLLPGSGEKISYLVIRTACFWGRNKVSAVKFIGDVNPNGVYLAIDHNKFDKLPDYKTDASIEEEVENALWNDEILRVTDFHEITVCVTNGIVSLNGHITGMMNHKRIENAVGKVKSILEVKDYLVADDKLLLKVTEALIPIDRTKGNQVFVKVENGLVILNGNVINLENRILSEQYSARIPQVRGIINNISVPGIDLETVDQRFIQPAVGEKIFFTDGMFGMVRQVVINPNNRRVTDMILEGQFPDNQRKPKYIPGSDIQTPEHLAVIPISLIRYLTPNSGFLIIDSTDTARYQEFDTANFIVPDADWLPPYPYKTGNVNFFIEQKDDISFIYQS